MIALKCFCLRIFTLLFKSKIRLEAENVILRHQLIALERKIRGRIRLLTSRLAAFAEGASMARCDHASDGSLEPQASVAWRAIHSAASVP
jgi:hypothetical protein